MVNREALVFCADGGDDYFGWFWHEADVLLYARGKEVEAKNTTAAEARELYAKHYYVEDTYVVPPEDVEDEKAFMHKDWEKRYTLEELEELLEDLVGTYGNFPLNEELDHLPNSSGFWQEAADLGIPGVGFSDDISPASGDVFEVHGVAALEALREAFRGQYRIVVLDGVDEYTGFDSEGALRFIEGARRR